MEARRRRPSSPLDCSSCGTPNPEGAHFCGECGASLAPKRACPDCGTENPVGQKFCNGCGRRLVEAEPTPRADGRDPRAYTPDHLADKIRTARPSLEGERKHVTVLFADVKGSMELAEAVDPEELRSIMDRFFQILCDGVHRFEGTVDKFTGDGIMALFGAPIAHEDHAARACYAALHLRDALAAHSAELRRERGLSFSVRIGLNSGEVVVGTIGEDLSLSFTAIGQTVGLAQRMEALAEPGSAYLTEHTAGLVAGYFELRELGPFDVKGVSDPIGVHELVGVGSLRTRLDVSEARGFSRFVGRMEEMARLETALSRVSGGSGQVIGIVAEAGVGKSRLCREFAEGARASGVDVWEAHCLSHAKAVPFLPVLEILRTYFGVSEQDDDQTARQKIAGKLLLLDESFKDVLPLVFDFLGVPDPDRPMPRIDPEARQRQLFGTLNRILKARSAEAPGVILLEDLHWIDPGSEAFLENLVEGAGGTRTLVLTNFRPEYRADWMQKSYYEQLPLLPLGREAIEELLKDLLGSDPSLDGLAELVCDRTGGNPFFIEEVVRTLVESGSLEGAKGAYRLAHEIGEVAIPDTVQSVLAARIDRLSEREKALLQTASVIGRRFTEPVLRRVVGLSPEDLAGALRALVAGEFLLEEALYPEAEYAFTHPLTEEVAYRSQLGERRGRVHAAVAEAIAELTPPERLDEHAALLSHHFEAGGRLADAASWSARAAGWAGFNDPAEAVRHWDRVRELTDADGTPETTALGITARTMLLNFAWRVGIAEGEAAEAFEARTDSLYRDGKELAERIGQPGLLALVLATYAGVRGVAGEMEEAAELSLQALRLTREAQQPALEAAVSPFPSYTLWCVGRLPDALEIMERTLELTKDDHTLGAGIGVGSPHAWALLFSGSILGQMGRLDEQDRRHEAAMRAVREAGDLETQCWVHLNAVYGADFRGDAEGGLAHARQGVELAERTGGAFSRVLAYAFLAYAHVVREEWDEAVDFAGRSLELSAARRVGRETEGFALHILARAHLGLGDLAAARAVADKAVAISVERAQGGFGANVRLARARVLLASGELGEAKRELEAALDAAHRTSWHVVEPQVREALAEVAEAQGDEETRARELAEARRLYVEIGAPARAAALPEPVG